MQPKTIMATWLFIWEEQKLHQQITSCFIYPIPQMQARHIIRFPLFKSMKWMDLEIIYT